MRTISGTIFLSGFQFSRLFLLLRVFFLSILIFLQFFVGLVGRRLIFFIFTFLERSASEI